MTSNIFLSNPNPSVSFVNNDLQLHLKKEKDKVVIILPSSNSNTTVTDWSTIWESLENRLNNRQKSWASDTPVDLVVKDHLLDARQLQMLQETLTSANLKLTKVITSRRQTAVASVMAGYSVEQKTDRDFLIDFQQEIPLEENLLENALYHENTVRSGVEIQHDGTIIIMGDVNPGGIINSSRDILVWGALRGIAHAGNKGNRQARIMALKMQPTQLRIADTIARPPEEYLDHYEPEIAYIGENGIRINPGNNFNKIFSFSKEVNAWLEL